MRFTSVIYVTGAERPPLITNARHKIFVRLIPNVAEVWADVLTLAMGLTMHIVLVITKYL